MNYCVAIGAYGAEVFDGVYLVLFSDVPSGTMWWT
jgi:hypothetical protein